MSSLLIEITSEDIPAKGQITQGLKFLQIIAKNLQLEESSLELAISPRHLAIFTKKFELDKKISIKGPKLAAENHAIQGFISRHQIVETDLIVKDACYFYEKTLSKQEVKDLLIKQIEAAFHEMVWPKSMIVGQAKTRWIRPIKSLLAIIDEEVLSFSFGDIKASNYILLKKKKVIIEKADLQVYLSNLRKEDIFVSYQEREKIILDGIEALLKPLNLTLINNQSLLEELVALVENPQVYLGQIKKEFLSLPKEILLTSLAHHQKYLLVQNDKGELAPYFLIVANIKAKDGGVTIISGHEKVLQARLQDAIFFLKEDQKHYPKNKAPQLERVVFHEKIGNLSEKVDRIKNLVSKILKELKIELPWLEEAAELCKNDLLTKLVSEFPELQGIAGYYYSKEAGFSEEIALAIRDHYKPLGLKDSLPTSLGGAILAMADKLDNLISFFKVGIKPTATKDPFALRRAALGFLRITNHFNLSLNLTSLVEEDLLNFIKERAKQAQLDL